MTTQFPHFAGFLKHVYHDLAPEERDLLRQLVKVMKRKKLRTNQIFKGASFFRLLVRDAAQGERWLKMYHECHENYKKSEKNKRLSGPRPVTERGELP